MQIYVPPYQLKQPTLQISSLVQRHSGMNKWCHQMVVVNDAIMAAFERKTYLQKIK